MKMSSQLSPPPRNETDGVSLPPGIARIRLPDSSSSSALLAAILPLARVAIWEAWDEPLALIRLDTGRTDEAFALEPGQIEPGALWEENIYPSDRENFRAFLSQAGGASAGKCLDYRLIVGEGELLWVRHWLLQCSPSQNGRRRLQGFIMAIPEQKYLEWECLRVSERERNRIGQDIHDDMCQVLTGLTFLLRGLSERARKASPELGEEIDELNAQAAGAAERLRSMAHGLFPAHLNYATLEQALAEFTRQTRVRFSVVVTLDFPPGLPAHSPEQITQVYRIAQEAVSNSIRHGRAKALKLTVTTLSGGMQMTIEDDGAGFPLAAARPEGIGMNVIQYRARALGGFVTFTNLSPRGAAVHLHYPVETGATQVRTNTAPSL